MQVPHGYAFTTSYISFDAVGIYHLNGIGRYESWIMPNWENVIFAAEGCAKLGKFVDIPSKSTPNWVDEKI